MSFNKLKWIFGTSLVFLLFLATNLMDLSQFRDIKETTVNIYEDRLLSKNHLFSISELVQEKAVAHARHDTAYYRLRDGNVNVELEEALSNYESAKLTSKEKDNLALLRDAIEDLEAAESQFLNLHYRNQDHSHTSDQEAHDRNAKNIEKEFENIHRRLNALAEIQVVEGRRQMVSARESVATVEVLMKIEIIMLIVIFLGIQILVLYPSRKKKE